MPVSSNFVLLLRTDKWLSHWKLITSFLVTTQCNTESWLWLLITYTEQKWQFGMQIFAYLNAECGVCGVSVQSDGVGAIAQQSGQHHPCQGTFFISSLSSEDWVSEGGTGVEQDEGCSSGTGAEPVRFRLSRESALSRRWFSCWGQITYRLGWWTSTVATEPEPFRAPRTQGTPPVKGSRPPTAPSSPEVSSILTYSISSGSWLGRSSRTFSSSPHKIWKLGLSFGLNSQQENIRE